MIEVTFKSNRTFWCEETRSQYSEGMYYTAVSGSKVSELLPQWLSEGKAQVVKTGAVSSGARARARGVASVGGEPVAKRSILSKIKEVVFSWL